MLNVEEKANIGHGLSKVERYGWTIKDRPGALLDIPKGDMRVDETYQRAANENKIRAIAREWSWIACGVIIVAERDNVFYVVDGQHRVIAARRRADIKTLPCIVFETTGAVEEAAGFLRANTQRKMLGGVDRFRALVATGNPAAVFVRDLCAAVHREVKATGAANSVRCVMTLLKYAAQDPKTLEKLWPLINSLHEGEVISERIVEGLMYLEQHMPKGESLTDRKWHDRVLRIGAASLIEAANKASAFYARGGAKVWAIGMVQALNYKHRYRLILEGVSFEEQQLV